MIEWLTLTIDQQKAVDFLLFLKNVPVMCLQKKAIGNVEDIEKP